MKLSIEFPSVASREGPEAVRRFAQSVDALGALGARLRAKVGQ